MPIRPAASRGLGAGSQPGGSAAGRLTRSTRRAEHQFSVTLASFGVGQDAAVLLREHEASRTNFGGLGSTTLTIEGVQQSACNRRLVLFMPSEPMGSVAEMISRGGDTRGEVVRVLRHWRVCQLRCRRRMHAGRSHQTRPLMTRKSRLAAFVD